MQAAAWVELLRRIPADQYDKLMLVVGNGLNINLQGVLRTEGDYLVIRGRLSASTEGGRVFFVPYDQIGLIGYREAVPEAEIAALFGSPAATDTKRSSLEATPVPSEAAGDSGQPDTPPVLPRPTPTPTLTPAKSALLERLRRARLGQGAIPPTPSR